jgi:hypothetical protein
MVCPVCCSCWPTNDVSDHYEDCRGEPVEVVPVPDEQAIERAAAVLVREDFSGDYAYELARAVLAAALEQPE